MERRLFRKDTRISAAKPLGGRVPLANLPALGATIGLGCGAMLLAQMVGPEIVIRDEAPGGGVQTLAAAFEPSAAYVAWMDTRNEPSFGGDIYAQKLSADGAPAWTANGVVVSAAEGQQSFPSVIPGGSSGAIVAWLERAQWVIMAQRVAASGETQWTLNGQVVGAASSQALVQPLIHRGSDGGLLVTWWQSGVANVPEGSFPALAQKLAADGAPLWDPEPPDATDTWGSGIVVLNGITRGRSVSDGANGMIVAYIDTSSVRAIRVTHEGALPWDASGVTLTASNVVTTQPP